MAYYAFDLDAWAKVISASTPDDAPTHRRLDAALRKMSAALQSTRDRRTWQVAAKPAIGHRARVVEQLRALGLEARDLKFRMAWRAAMGRQISPSLCLTSCTSTWQRGMAPELSSVGSVRMPRFKHNVPDSVPETSWTPTFTRRFWNCTWMVLRRRQRCSHPAMESCLPHLFLARVRSNGCSSTGADFLATRSVRMWALAAPSVGRALL